MTVALILFQIGIFLISIFAWVDLLVVKVFKDIALKSSSSKSNLIRLRRWYWKAAQSKMKDYIRSIDNGNDLDYIRNITVTIMMYELDTAKYKETFILSGFNRLSLEVVTMCEKTERFVEFHKEKDYYLTAENLLEKFLLEFDNQKQY